MESRQALEAAAAVLRRRGGPERERLAARLLAEAAAEPGPAERVELLVTRGRAAEAVQLGAAALERTTGDEHTRLCLRLAEACLALRRWSDAERYADRAADPADPAVLAILADAAFGSGDLGRAAHLAERAGDTVPALITKARCEARTAPDQAAATYRAAARRAGHDGLLVPRVAALIGLGTIELNDGGDSPALAEARRTALDGGQLAHVLWVDVLRAEARLLVDGPAAGLAAAERAAGLAAALELPALQAVAELIAALARAGGGDPAAARALAAQAAARPLAPPEVRAGPALVDAVTALLQHDVARCAAAAEQSIEILRGRAETAPVPTWGLWVLANAITGRAAGPIPPLAAARGVNRAALEFAAAVTAGDPVRHYAAGNAALACFGWWGRLLRLLVLEAAVRDGWGDPVPGLRADLAEAERVGDDAAARIGRGLLRRAGAATRKGRGDAIVPPALRAAGVTSREMDVLHQLREGLTNREIADRLFLSPRTVDTHVAALLRKTGTDTRAALIRSTR